MSFEVYIYIPIFLPIKTVYKYKCKKKIQTSKFIYIYIYIPIFLPIKTAYIVGVESNFLFFSIVSKLMITYINIYV
jgi:hypothetical protein